MAGYVLIERVLDIMNHGDRALFALRRERCVDVCLPKRHSKIAVCRAHTPPPAWQLLPRSLQGVSVKVPVLVDKRFAQIRCGTMHHIPAQVDFPIIDRMLLDEWFKAAKELRRTHDVVRRRRRSPDHSV